MTAAEARRWQRHGSGKRKARLLLGPRPARHAGPLGWLLWLAIGMMLLGPRVLAADVLRRPGRSFNSTLGFLGEGPAASFIKVDEASGGSMPFGSSPALLPQSALVSVGPQPVMGTPGRRERGPFLADLACPHRSRNSVVRIKQKTEAFR